MNLNHQIHHEEQMSAYRRDFLKEWLPKRKALFTAHGFTDKDLAMEELRQWRQWLKKGIETGTREA